MKSKVRLFSLVLACVFFGSYVGWPNTSYQSLSFEQIAPAMVVSSTDHQKPQEPQERCRKYFDVVRASAPSRPSNSRYLTSKQIANHIDHLRVYLKCHLDLQLAETKDSALMGAELLPMFSGKLPILSRHDWAPFFSGVGCYWSRYVTMARSRGIVISLDDANTEFACRLLQVLQHVGSSLPIQFIHKGDLSNSAMEKILLVAKGKQAVDFIDVSPTLKSGYSSVFRGYNNKWFAALFSTFEEIILMDADVVPFINPEEFFAFEGYKRTGAYFFKDRELSETLADSEVDFFMRLLPKGGFNISIEGANLNNNFFRFKSKHVMESGVVVLRRSTHLSGIIISLALQYWFRSGRIMYGDKDLFWLGQLISGNSNFHFNENAAAAIGVLEGNDTICSTQLGHLDEKRRLLWTNGALNQCKRNTWLMDYFRYPKLRHLGLWGLRDSYKSAVQIKQAILPASIESLNDISQSHFVKDRSRGCGGIYYCASSDDGGEIVEFSKQEQAAYKEIISVWNAPLVTTF